MSIAASRQSRLDDDHAGIEDLQLAHPAVRSAASTVRAYHCAHTQNECELAQHTRDRGRTQSRQI